MFDVKSASLNGLRWSRNSIPLRRSGEMDLPPNASYGRIDLSLSDRAPAEVWRDSSSKNTLPVLARTARVQEGLSRQVAKDEPILLWGALAVFFLTLVFAYPVVMAWMGDPHGLRYLIRLGSTLGILAVMGAISYVSYLVSQR